MSEQTALFDGNQHVREAQSALDRAKLCYKQDDPDSVIVDMVDVFIRKLDEHCSIVNRIRLDRGRA